jgi:hypothetical protein
MTGNFTGFKITRLFNDRRKLLAWIIKGGLGSRESNPVVRNIDDQCIFIIAVSSRICKSSATPWSTLLTDR